MILRLARPVLSLLRTDVRSFSQTAHLAKSRFWPENRLKWNPRTASTEHTQNNVPLAQFLAGTQEIAANGMVTQQQGSNGPSWTKTLETGFGDSEETWKRREVSVVSTVGSPQGIHAGRSFLVEKDFTHAWRMLQRTLRRNSFVYELRLGARHEKKGAKRRRLASERWRRRFAHEVRKKVQLVNEIRARGA